MAAILYILPEADSKTLFRSGLTINDSVTIPFLQTLIDDGGIMIITEVTMQNRDTVQYFLTFNDFISYFYFGKGLGSLSINGSILGDCHQRTPLKPAGSAPARPSSFYGVGDLLYILGSQVRGKEQTIQFGGYNFVVVLSSFTLRASSEEFAMNFVDFNLQMEIIRHDLPAPTFESECNKV
jgi:hypothetical protein